MPDVLLTSQKTGDGRVVWEAITTRRRKRECFFRVITDGSSSFTIDHEPLQRLAGRRGKAVYQELPATDGHVTFDTAGGK